MKKKSYSTWSKASVAYKGVNNRSGPALSTVMLISASGFENTNEQNGVENKLMLDAREQRIRHQTEGF